MLFKPLGPYFSAGVAIKNINTGIKWNSGRTDYVKTTLTLAAAQSVIYERLLFAFEAESGTDWDLKYRAGGEYIFNSTFALRLGLNQGDIATGFGLTYQNYKIDYSFSLDNDGFADLHRFSFSAGF